jgi:hypothetical protein
MLDKIINLLFSWDRLRVAIFAEVDWFNSITRTLNDPESMKTTSAFWCEEDGWRGWGIKEDGSYYFHDLPEKDLGGILDIVVKKETVY